MKKQFIAAAVAAALAAPAMAQNVSISGYLETGYTKLETSGAATSTTLGSGIFGSNRIVLSGSEDLGGGLKAGFRLEADLNITTGKLGKAPSGDATATQDTIFSRGTEVNLSGAFGMVRLGKFDHQGGENTDINVVGNIALATGIASSDKGNGTAEGVEMGSDRDGTIAYRTPAVLGGYFEVAYTPQDQITAANSADGAQGELTSIYYEGAVGKASVRAGYATQKAIGSITASNNDATRMGIGAAYDFGMFSASAHTARQTTIAQAKVSENTLSAKVPVGNGLDVRGVYQKYDVETTDTGDFREYTLAVVKALSKRTNVMAAVTSVDNKPSTTADTTRTYIGVSHTF